ncbi:MAG: DUF934 domain-containing protein [Pseudomonadales bacterium]|nr:DUF934 domain-containing protein [Pseudomonadales bacterium]
MAALIEIDRVSGTLRGADAGRAGLPLLAPEAWHGQADAGLRLPGDAEPEARFAEAPLIAIEFPAFHDGRGLSLAVLLRTRFGFTGELRAIGDVRPDLLHYLVRCGFDTFELAEGVSIDLADPRLVPHLQYYQASVRDPEPAFRRVARGRAA